MGRCSWGGGAFFLRCGFSAEVKFHAEVCGGEDAAGSRGGGGRGAAFSRINVLVTALVKP